MIEKISILLLSIYMLCVRKGYAFTSVQTRNHFLNDMLGGMHSYRRFHTFKMLMQSRESSFSRTEVRKMKIEDLKKELRQRNLDVTGLRKDLMQRLLDDLDQMNHSNKVHANPLQTKHKTPREKIDLKQSISMFPDVQYILRYSGMSNHVVAQGSCGLILYNSFTEKEVWSGQMFFDHGESALEAEMKGLLITIRNLLKIGVKHLIIQGYAQSVVLNQLQGNFGVRAKSLKASYLELKSLLNLFDSCEVWGIPQDQVKVAERLAKKAMDRKSTVGFDYFESEDKATICKDEDESLIQDANIGIPSANPLKCNESKDTMSAPRPTLSPTKEYILRFDGGSRGNPGNSGSGMVIYDSESGIELWSAYEWLGSTTNNVAEYQGLIHGMELAKDMGARNIVCQGDSTLIIKQVSGEWECKKDHLKPLYRKVKDLMKCFVSVKFQYIPRAENYRADELANQAMDSCTSSDIDSTVNDSHKMQSDLSHAENHEMLSDFLSHLPEPTQIKSVQPKKIYTLRFTGGSKENCCVSVAEITDALTSEKQWNGTFFTRNQICTQIVAQYIGLIIGLRKASSMGIKRLLVESPSEVAIRQMNGKYNVRNAGVKMCHQMAMNLLNDFDEVDFNDTIEDDRATVNLKTLYFIGTQERRSLLGDY